ncbi:hypothetical protein BS50DRAFT_640827 [Corynespora cassiicola Philippines]|uniref:Avirulence Effector AvrLm4-7 domain-containing protein n=1 Tax=Corynespora cassiicola Philippines TaxID=1448308 RepID=A0A2T2N2T0_CORCC|nr:hypothetical protein BS50DRAFT_640827 [Corynespora cassiicola Philippines]
MKVLLSIIFLYNTLGFVTACQQWKVGYASKGTACELDAGYWRNKCRDMSWKYIDYSRKNQERLGRDIGGDAYCDPCTNNDPKCYCRVTFWRYKEWMGQTIPYFEDADWAIDSTDPFEKLPHKNVDC